MPTGDTGTEPRNSQPQEYTEPADGRRTRYSGSDLKALRPLRRELSEDEFSTSGVQKMVLDQLDRLIQENSKLKEIENCFHKCDKNVAVLREQLKKPRAFDIFVGTAVAIGSLLIGVSASLWSMMPISQIAGAAGVVLLSGSVAARLVVK